VRYIARLVLFFSLFFVLVLLGAAGAGFFRGWIETARQVPAGVFRPLTEILGAAHRAIPCALYIAVLFTLSYSVRREAPAAIAIPCVFILAVAFSSAAALGLRRAEGMGTPSVAAPLPTLGAPGLILSRGDTFIVLLGDPGNPRGNRVVSLSGRPLIYQEAPLGPEDAVPELPPVVFEAGSIPFINDLAVDFSLTDRQFQTRMDQGLGAFCVYAAALSLLLVSLRFLFGFSSWPLANIFLGALAFRGVLAFESFLNGREMQEFIGLFLGRWIPPAFISPGVFCALGVLIILYRAFASLARERRGRNG
jgi:hypothetical protein